MPTVYVNRLLTQILRPKLELISEFERPKMMTRLPADVLENLPLIVAKGTPGAEVDPRFGADTAVVQVDVYAADSEDMAQQWAAWTRDQLFEAQRAQTMYEAGYVSSFETVVVPWSLPDSSVPDNVERYLAEYRLTLRPAPA